MRLTLFSLIALIALSFPAYAANPKETKETLQQIEARMAEEKAKQQEIERKVTALESDMKGLKTKLIKTTSQVQKNETELDTVERKLSDLSARKQEITGKLEKDRSSLAELVTALERIRRLPPSALIARPGAPLQTAQASVVLGAIMPELNKRAEDFRTTLEELQRVENDLAENKEKLQSTSDKLKDNKQEMEGLMAERQDAIKKGRNDLDGQEKQVVALSRKASDLKDLIEKIEKERQAHARAEPEKVEGKKRKNRIDENQLGGSLASLGDALLPISGAIAIKYGQRDDLGASSEGLHINSRAGSVVVAPMSGVVRYAGPFKTYGSIVLIEHKNNYHSLIAGLGKIDTVVGQRVDAGEPVGKLGSSPSLYYELRYNGQPINPARKFGGLG